jgi:hypothetical protein
MTFSGSGVRKIKKIFLKQTNDKQMFLCYNTGMKSKEIILPPAARGSFEKPPLDPAKLFIIKQKFLGGSWGAVFQKSPPGRRRQKLIGIFFSFLKNPGISNKIGC